MSYAEYYNLRPGDRIILPIDATGAIKHFAINLGYINGVECLSENQKNRNVQTVTADSFFPAIQGPFFIEPFIGTEQERAEIVEKAFQLNGTPYNFWHFNCEHYANYVQYGKAESPQIKKGILFGLAALIIGLNYR